VDPRAGLDEVEKRKFLTLLGLELRPFGRPAPVELQYLNIIKYLFKLIQFILKLVLLSKRYPIIYTISLWVGWGRENGVYILYIPHMMCLRNFII
jgi:hypothetical protein